ncbi:PREDICTED: uncharacterized protein LOC109350589 [Lupinus angustifolius]|uniref:uncharacterized protein LOC109350589 n=1 Tax=Lupinus angustifolius TaxID=3871 RepID=UPI00092EB941|nr:PREDICTED: uncharacterized protein LOC109350589 [Lupinus angustifolius]
MSSTIPLIPWGFLGDLGKDTQEETTKAPLPPATTIKKSFAQALRSSCDIATSQLPQPCIKGEAIAIKIPEEDYQAGLLRCKSHLHGRMILSKGDTPLKFAELKSTLTSMWSMIRKWSMISLGKGFYEFSFSSLEDMRTICSVGSWNLKPGILRLFLWSPDFNPNLQKQSHTQCWIKIYNLPQEYWSPRIIFSIAGGIGTPISMDEATHTRSFGHFAKVMVEINLKAELPDQILVEREGFAFFVSIEYENLPDFCQRCHVIGHVVHQCRKQIKKPEAEVTIKSVPKKPKQTDKPIEYREINDLVINLDIDKGDKHNVQNMERLTISQEPMGNLETHFEEELLATRVENSIHEERDGESSNDNIIVQETAKMNQVAANDIRIVIKTSFWSALNLKLFVVNNRGNHIPSLWGLCSPGLDPSILTISNQHISISLSVENKNLNVCVVYAHINHVNRRSLWLDIQVDLLATQGPWCCIGDFNATLGADECRSATLPSRVSKNEFLSFINSSSLLNVSTLGAQFTWTNKRRGNALFENKLDRSLCNGDWMKLWSQVSCGTLPRIASDHHPLLFSSASTTTPRICSFKFQKMWLQNIDCKRSIKESWQTEVIGCPMFILSQKLKRLKKELKHWNYNVFGNIHQMVKMATANLDTIQSSINDLGADEALLDQEALAQNELLKALNVEEVYWKDKARNTAFSTRLLQLDKKQKNSLC